MKIAPGVTESDWKSLDLSSPHSMDWEKAILIFQRRIQKRFIEPVDTLIEIEQKRRRNKRNYGFAILAIDCLLIETLQAFEEGIVDTNRAETRGSKYLIEKFLIFCPRFKWDRKTASKFYDDFRCGIFHQAETKHDSMVRSEGPLLISESSGLIVNRTEFHQRMKQAFCDYQSKLRDEKQEKLRENFYRKMNHICRENKLASKNIQ